MEDTVSVDSHQYGELDVFIQGLQLEEHLPLFKKHHVDFAVVLTMNDSDLRQVGQHNKHTIYVHIVMKNIFSS